MNRQVEKELTESVLSNIQYALLNKALRYTTYQIYAKQLFLKGINDSDKIHQFCVSNDNLNGNTAITNALYNALQDIQTGHLKISEIPDISL